MRKIQKGFSAVEILILLFIIGVIGGIGWFVYKQNPTPDTTYTPQNQNKTEVAEYTDCHTEADKAKEVKGATVEQYEWTTINHAKVMLSDWNVTLTLPNNLVGKAVCRYTSNGYVFSTLAVINDNKCVTYYRTQELIPEGLEIWRFSPATEAHGQVGGDASGSLQDYYQAHKAKDGSYFTVPGTAQKYYLVGENFYAAFGDGKIDTAARTAACKDEKPDFRQSFTDSVRTLKTI
jgi:hypothetical protein